MKVIIAKTQKEIMDNILVRGKVFIIEQMIDWAIEFDGLDESAVLFTAYIDDCPIGAARLLNDKVGRVATLKEYRKQGVGKAIMLKIEEYAKSKGMKKLRLHAQLYVKDFYEKLGYEPYGDIFQEAEIDHISMEKIL